MDIDRKTVQRVVKMRNEGKPWSEICEKFNQPLRWQLQVRPLMKELDPKSVLPLGPGSPKYGKATAKPKATAKRTSRKASS
jgi:hypothetical protein